MANPAIVRSPASITLRIPWTAIRSALRDTSVAAAGLWWATYLTWGTGGREPHTLSLGLLLLVPALLLVQPWRILRHRELLLALGVASAGFVVAATAPTGWAGANDAASYAYAALLYLLVRAWAIDGNRRLCVLGVVVAAGGCEFAKGWLAWWGGQDQTRLFQGTFYWHNQVGIFLAAASIAGLGVIAFGDGIARVLAWFVVPLCAAGTLFTTSRGSQFALVLGTLVLSVAALADARRLARIGRLVLAAFAAVATAVLLTRPPFFPHATWPWDGTSARSASLSGNGIQRFEDWRRGWAIFRHWPISGAGFHSFASATTIATSRHDRTVTAFAHNGYVQAASDGGLVLAVPVFLAAGLLLWLALRGILPAVRSHDVVTVSAAATLVALLLHSGMDFDWSYPSLLALTAVVGALSRLPSPKPVRSGVYSSMAYPAVVALVIILGVVGAWHGGLSLNIRLPGAS